ncbi:potassium transporter Kup [Pelomonas aquatica]|uniref:Probable potassium transport system protein Kup n=2 Tax=Pelomonas aquatica TaxID=431058 RepID=A0A9X4LFC2_9BURK|nr:potassium transporter Kup [Pelomonas aquatica]MCY4752946.1 potassium transporter Kup [Pelomonas aquatica]MDG0862114.1 potassium transporter Kup [Pelomonas aquatica]
MTTATDSSADAAHTPPRHGLAALTLGAIGVVYGDIGTSPLYTVKEVFTPATGVALAPNELIGAISAIVWALMLVVTLKYVVLILRADNRGEGGGLALTALATQAVRHRPGLRRFLLLMGVFGATLFYGDSVITPAVSVMGAIEGLEIVSPQFTRYVLPLSLVVLVLLFVVQKHGTHVVGRIFGPVILLWFGVLAVTGALQIAQQPAILAALNPVRALEFLAGRGWQVFAVVGAIVLALTGAEALYADMGHFGARPIRIAWTGIVFPALALNYLGQGALLIGDPGAIDNPFYRLFPAPLVLPAVVLAAAAAVIASQAVISGAYSMTKQAIQLGFLPRMPVRNTSAAEAGQIYIASVNWALLAGVVGAVLLFRSSSALAGAYGIAVTLTMMITTVLTFFVIRNGWRLPAPLAWGATAFFLALDALLVSGCAIKIVDGGWFPLALGALLFVLMSTWARGRRALQLHLADEGLPLLPFVESLHSYGDAERPRAMRTAIYPVANPELVPPALLHNLKHYQVLHERNVVLTVTFCERPYVPDAERLHLEALAPGFWRLTLTYGFMDQPDVPAALALCSTKGLQTEPAETSYFLSRETLVPRAGMAHWREALFATMSRNASSAADYFRLPGNAVVELGTKVQL